MVAAAVVGGAVIGGVSSNMAAKKGAKASQQATDASIGEQARQYDQTRADFAPARNLGNAAIGDINSLYGRTTNPDGSVTSGGTPDMSRFFTSPDYQFNLAEGQRAIDNSLVARGRGLSGAGVKAGVRFASGMAAGQFDNYYSRLASQAGLGQGATGQTSAAGANAANNIGNAYMQNGANRASAYTMGAQGINNAAQGGISNLMLQRYLSGGSLSNGWGSGANANSALAQSGFG